MNQFLDKGVQCYIDPIDLGNFVIEYCIKFSSKDNTESLSVMEQSVIYRNRAYKEYFENYPESTRILIDYIFKHNYVFPESIIFTSLGLPDNIKFV